MTLPSDIERLVPARVLTIEPWIDPAVEAVGYELRDAYVEVFLASVGGPTGTLLLRRVGLGFAFQPQGFALDRRHGRRLGRGCGPGPQQPLVAHGGPLGPFRVRRRAGRADPCGAASGCAAIATLGQPVAGVATAQPCWDATPMRVEAQPTLGRGRPLD
jgi:hypothetical protein